MKYIGGLDVGTTGCKVAVFDETAQFCKSFYQEYNVVRKGGQHELDIEQVWQSVRYVLQEAGKEYCLSAIGVTSFGETFTMLDENGQVLCPSMLYTDPRGEEECAELTAIIPEEDWIARTGCCPHPMFSLPKIVWLQKHRPELYAKAKRILLGEDFIVYRLSGIAQIDYSLAARTSALNLQTKDWDTDILKAAKVDPQLLSRPVPTGTLAGPILPELAEELGLPAELQIVSGAHDQVASMVGAGIYDPDTSMDGIGTVECIPLVFSHIPQDLSFYRQGYVLVPYLNGQYACYAFSYAGGSCLKWFRDTFAELEKANAAAEGKNVYAMLDASIPEEPTGILALPYFSGAATPYMDLSATGALVGLTFEHTKADIYKALMEGVSYEILKNLRTLAPYGIAPKLLRATGGGASSDVWLQIKADIMGIPIAALNCPEVGAAGTALLAGHAIGVYPDINEFEAKIAPLRKIFYPDAERHTAYGKLFARYEHLHDTLKTLPQ